MSNIKFMRSCISRRYAAASAVSILLGIAFLNLRGEMEDMKMKTDPVTVLKREKESYDYMESSPRRCLAFDGEMDDLIEQSKQVFLVMLPKAAGTTSEIFTSKCMEEEGLPTHTHGNMLNDKAALEEMFMNNVRLPTIISSHLYQGDRTLMRLIQQTTRDSLIIFIHREETERVVSSIKMIVEDWLCSGRAEKRPNSAKKLNALNIDYEVVGNKCTIPERSLINPVIKNRMMEISEGANRVLTCDIYDAIEEHAPNFVFMDFRQMDQLQTVLAKHHCPGLLPKLPIHANVSSEKKQLDIKIRLQKNNRQVSFSKWLEAKSELIEFSLSMKNEAQCQAQTRVMETDLKSCPDRLLQISSASFSPFTSILAP